MGANHETPNSLGYQMLHLSGKSRMVAYLALRNDGKVKMSERRTKGALQEAVLGDCLVNESTGAVSWQDGVVSVASKDQFEILARCVRKLFEVDGVDFDLVGAANDLLDAIEDKEMEARRLERGAAEPADRK